MQEDRGRQGKTGEDTNGLIVAEDILLLLFLNRWLLFCSLLSRIRIRGVGWGECSFTRESRVHLKLRQLHLPAVWVFSPQIWG